MSRTIDAEDAKMRVLNLWAKDRPIEDACEDGNMYAFGILDSMDAIDDTPTVEREPGEWVAKTENCHSHWVCSECGAWALLDWNEQMCLSNFCPHCGARMKGADDETD